MSSRGSLVQVVSAVTLAVLLAAGTASSQAITGEITGRVVDSAGLGVPGATVTAVNDGTGLTRVVVTGADGDYTIVQLPPGTYTVNAELTGFKRATAPGITITVGMRRTLPFELSVGALTETVQVTAASPLVETTRSDVAGVVTEREIAALPMLNRTFAGLSITMPEARPVGNFDPTKTRIGNFAISGGDGRQLDVNVDGGDNKDNVVGSLIQNFAYESIQEFQVLQHRWSAESGRAVGGVVNVITKSGTNSLKGSLFGTYRDQDLAAKDFFQKRGGAKQTFARWEYGGSAGGPIRRDNLFFFGALERFDEPKGETPVGPTRWPSWRSCPARAPSPPFRRRTMTRSSPARSTTG